MPTPTSAPGGSGGSGGSWGSGGPGYRRHFRYGGGDVRASDAERADVADRLSRHYQDGRLDQAEFNERLDRAMNAKTRADFNGLFYDLPDLPDAADHNGQSGPRGSAGGPAYNPGRIQQRQARRHSFNYILFLCFVVAVTVLVAHSLMHWYLPWVLVGVVAFLCLRNQQMRRR